MVDEKPPGQPKEKLPGKNAPHPLVLGSREKKGIEMSRTQKKLLKQSSRSSR
jgi:hypothetical protein